MADGMQQSGNPLIALTDVVLLKESLHDPASSPFLSADILVRNQLSLSLCSPSPQMNSNDQ